MVQMVKNLPANAGDPGSIPGSGRSPCMCLFPVCRFFFAVLMMSFEHMGFPGGSDGKESAC